VGVVPAITSEHLDKKNPYKEVYVSAFQHPLRTMHLVLKTSLPSEAVVHSLEQAVHQVDPAVAVYNIQTMRQRFGDKLQGRRTTMAMVLAFGGIALVLAMVGVYGVLSFGVRQRTKECGIRLALGATPQNLLWLIINDGLRLLAIGLTIGLALAVAFGYIASSQLFEVAPFDPLTLIGAVIVLSAVTLIACYLPARRAAKLDPTEALQN
jgi:ABC-type antimicrobial peptide transport system permease subunit